MARPIMVAVGGDSGTGKTTLCRGIDEIFGAERIVTLCLDDYHALDREQRKAVGLTALDPRANNFAAMEEDLWSLSEGRTISKPIYDHHDGRIKGPETVEPRDIVVVQGLFPLYTRSLRSLFDVTVWLDPTDDLKVGWKIQRDVAQRGYREEQVRAEIAKRQPDITAHIAPQAKHADLTVRFSRRSAETPNAALDARIRKGGRFKPLDYSEFASGCTSLRVVPGNEGGAYPETVIELDGDCDDGTAARLQTHILDSLGSRPALRAERIGRFIDRDGSERVSHTLALAQLLIARRICLVTDQIHAAAAA